MKRIIISEQQAKTLVKQLVNEQNQNEEIFYKINNLNFVVKDGKPYSIGDDGMRTDLPKLSEMEIVMHPKRLEFNAITNQMTGGNQVFGYYNDEPTQIAKNLALKMVGSPLIEIPVGQGFEAIVFDDFKRQVPIWVKINVLSGEFAGTTIGEPKLVKEKDGETIMIAKTRTKNYLMTISNPLGVGEVKGGGEENEKEVVYFCVSYNDKTKGITRLTQDKGDTGGAEWLKSQNKDIVDLKGPFSTREEAIKVCQPALPELLPFGDFFANNISKIKLSPSMPFVKQLKEYFDAGGTLSKITIRASASRVPAGHVEADEKAALWKDTRTYDNSATGNNNDGTGNLELTKARAYNLYAALIAMFPQLTNVPRELIALGSIGDSYKRPQKPKPGQNPNDPSLKGDDPNDPKYANFRRVDLILNK